MLRSFDLSWSRLLLLYLASQYYQQTLFAHRSYSETSYKNHISMYSRHMPYVTCFKYICHMLTPCILLSCLLSSTADNSKLVIFFQSLLDPNSCLHSLLPVPRDHNLVAGLRAARRFPALAYSTINKYRSVWQVSCTCIIFFTVLYVYVGYAPFYAQLYSYCTFSHLVILFFIWLFGHFGRKVDH